jgi:hypothetical protein
MRHLLIHWWLSSRSLYIKKEHVILATSGKVSGVVPSHFHVTHINYSMSATNVIMPS